MTLQRAQDNTADDVNEILVLVEKLDINMQDWTSMQQKHVEALQNVQKGAVWRLCIASHISTDQYRQQATRIAQMAQQLLRPLNQSQPSLEEARARDRYLVSRVSPIL